MYACAGEVTYADQSISHASDSAGILRPLFLLSELQPLAPDIPTKSWDGSGSGIKSDVVPKQEYWLSRDSLKVTIVTLLVSGDTRKLDEECCPIGICCIFILLVTEKGKVLAKQYKFTSFLAVIKSV